MGFGSVTGEVYQETDKVIAEDSNDDEGDDKREAAAAAEPILPPEGVIFRHSWQIHLWSAKRQRVTKGEEVRGHWHVTTSRRLSGWVEGALAGLAFGLQMV